MRKFLVVASAVLALVGTACGGSKATPLEMVRSAATATSKTETAKLFMTIDPADPKTPTATFKGAFDFAASRAKFTLDSSTLGVPGASGDIDAVMDYSDGFTQYMKVPGIKQETGKSWMKIDIAATLKQVCPDIDFASLLSAQSGDPTSALYNLGAAGTVTEKAKEKVRGEDTTHFHVIYDVAKVAELVPEELRASYRQVASFYTDTTQETDVWIDGDKHVRRLRQSVDPSAMKLPPCLNQGQSANPFQGAVTVTMEMYDFGDDVSIKLPSSSDVLDIADLSNGA